MPLIIPDNFCEASFMFKHVADPQPWAVTTGFSTGFGQEVPEDDVAFINLLGELAGAWNDNLKGLTSNQVTLLEITGRVGHAGGETSVISHTVGITGTQTDQMLPQNCALLVKKRTFGFGRTSQGRFFWPGMIREDKCDATGGLDVDWRNAVQDNFNNFLDDIHESSPPIDLYVLHNADGHLPNRVHTLVVDGVLSTQRRRLR